MIESKHSRTFMILTIFGPVDPELPLPPPPPSRLPNVALADATTNATKITQTKTYRRITQQ